MIVELKIGDKISLDGYEAAWIGFVTSTSYQISKIKKIHNENGKTSLDWLLNNLEVSWIHKWDWHTKN